MPEGRQSLQQRIQEQTTKVARDFYGESLGRLKGQLRGDRGQLEDLAEQLPEGDAQGLIWYMLDSYWWIEGTLDRAAHRLGVEDVVNEAAEQGQEGRTGQAAQGSRDTVADVVDRATGATVRLAGQAGQIAEDTQEAVGQAVVRIGQVAENLPGGQLLSRTTDDAGQTVQRAVNESGDIIEITLDEAGNLVDETLVGSLADLPAEEEQKIRTVKDESGTLVELRLGEDGSILGLQVSPGAK